MKTTDSSYIYFVFALWYITEIIFNTSAKTILGIEMSLLNASMSYVMFVLLMIRILFFQKNYFHNIVLILVITAFIVVSVLLSGSRYILATWMFIVAAQNVDLDRVIRCARNILMVLIPGIILFCYLGLLEDVAEYRWGIMRHSLGFVHSNQLGLRIFQLVLCIVYLNRDKIKGVHFMIIALAAFFCYRVPNSRTAAFSCILLFVLLALYVIVDLRHNKQTSLYVMLLIPVAAFANVLSVLFSIVDFSSGKAFISVDMLLSWRFSLCHKIYEIHGVTLLGNDIVGAETKRNLASVTPKLFLDNAYMFMLLEYGIITYTIFSIFYLFGMVYYKRWKENLLVIILFLYAVYGIMEKGMVLMQHNVFLLALGMPLYDKWSKEKKKIKQ